MGFYAQIGRKFRSSGVRTLTETTASVTTSYHLMNSWFAHAQKTYQWQLAG